MATNVKKTAAEIFPRLGLKVHNRGVFAGEWFGSGTPIEKYSPIDGSVLGYVSTATHADYDRAAAAAIQQVTGIWLPCWRVRPWPRGWMRSVSRP